MLSSQIQEAILAPEFWLTFKFSVFIGDLIELESIFWPATFLDKSTFSERFKWELQFPSILRVIWILWRIMRFFTCFANKFMLP